MNSTEARIAEALEPTIDIDLATQKRILKLELALPNLDHYELLGVPATADKSAIRAAYFALMREFHTDNFYGKNIGGFKSRLQRIAEALTRASDVLGRNKTRAEYDRYLSSRRTTLGARESVSPSTSENHGGGAKNFATRSGRPAVAPVDVVHIPRPPRTPQLDSDTGADESASDNELPDDVRQRNTPEPHSHNSSSQTTPTSKRSSSAPLGRDPSSKKDAARIRLARKMGIRPPSQDNSPDSAQVRRAVRADLKARFDARRVRESDRIDQFLKASMEARAAGDWAAAVNSLRMAISRKPDDVILAQQLEAMQAEADIALAPKFLEQAQYEEKNGSPDRAARSYERAAQGKKSPELFNKAARCLLSVRPKSEDDLRKTAEMARQAVALDKQKATYRITLARAYDAAGMRTSALGELNRALELEPNNNEAKELLKQFK